MSGLGRCACGREAVRARDGIDAGGGMKPVATFELALFTCVLALARALDDAVSGMADVEEAKFSLIGGRRFVFSWAEGDRACSIAFEGRF